jgi:hypothetical protein
VGKDGVHWSAPESVASKTQPPLPSSFQRPVFGEHWSGPESLASKTQPPLPSSFQRPSWARATIATASTPHTVRVTIKSRLTMSDLLMPPKAQAWLAAAHQFECRRRRVCLSKTHAAVVAMVERECGRCVLTRRQSSSQIITLWTT